MTEKEAIEWLTMEFDNQHKQITTLAKALKDWSTTYAKHGKLTEKQVEDLRLTYECYKKMSEAA